MWSLSCRLIHVPGCIIVGIIGLVIDIPLFTAIAVIKSPYLLFKGWYRLAQDAINREGPFLEIACIPVAGLTILLWPIIVIGFVLMTIFSSIFIGLYGAVVVFQVHNVKPNDLRQNLKKFGDLFLTLFETLFCRKGHLQEECLM